MSAAAAARISSNRNSHRGSNGAVNHQRWTSFFPPSPRPALLLPANLSRYESQKRRDWNSFKQYLKKRRPHSRLSHCSGVDVLEFLEDRFGDTKLHNQNCLLVNRPDPPSPCSCPLSEAWSSLDGLVDRLRVAYVENGGQSEMNPFSAGVVRQYLWEVKDAQAKGRGKSS